MSRYTTELRYICESMYDNEQHPFGDVGVIVENARSKIFDFPYPIFDEGYRKALETKIINHYYTREIGMETYGAWKLKLMARMNEIMPYYNLIYKSTLFEFNPLYDVDYYKSGNKQGVANDTTTSTNERKNESTSDGNVKTTGTNNDKTTHSGADVDTLTNSGADTDTVTRGGSDTDTDVTSGGDTITTTGSGKDVFKKGGVVNETSRTDHNTVVTTKYSDTPQGALTGVEAGNYLTSATIQPTTGNDSVTGTTTNSGQDETQYGGVTTRVDTLNTTHTQTHTKGTTETTDHDYESKHETEHAYGSVENTDHTLNTNTATTNNANSTTSDNGNTVKDIHSTEDYLEHVYGKTGGSDYATIINNYRKTFINVDLKIIHELEDLFFGLW